MDVFLLAAFAGLLVFVVLRFLKVRLTLLGYLGAGVLAVLAAWLIRQIVDFKDPVMITTDWVAIPLVTLLLGAVLAGLLLKVARPLR
jgi:hypothetical protein